jgi:hypothetical protein
MVRLPCILFFLLAIATCTLAQDSLGIHKLKLQSVVHVGLVNGSRGSSMALQAITGGNIRNTFAGIGLGLDYYRFRSVPLFVNVRQEFGKGKRNLFVYGDLGYNFDWLTDADMQETFMSTNSDYKGGTYYEGGTGYSFKLKNRDAILLSLGYSYKQLRSTTGSGICPVVGPCFNEKEKYAYAMRRWMIKAGWRF